KRKSNYILNKQKTEIQATLNELKATQAQLIQSEKMASLGELTAGIAHEIQNPLNFVNNFSDINNELIEEMNKAEDVNEIKTIANDIKQNNEKIFFHGKRADAIVKGMLQHSRKNTGEKEPTDINALADEYLRLSYHGLRAKDKSFNATMQTDFDEQLGKVNIVRQDVGRVLLNLFNNAFYAVNEKKKTAGETYQPTVSVQTKKTNNGVQIAVKDNGNGIPKNIIDKIFQPFFTTKPTGEGTGLGLSLSYDVITKVHNGTIEVQGQVDDESGKETEGTTFTINLPLTI
ncbi:MAG TPA: ATP-binding protein, partial [Parafilimonas sp.]